MFADRAKIIIRSGKGGDGHVSFRRELYVPNGGPDGGDGGRGGDVIFEVDEGQNTLGEYRHKHKFKAQDGQEGGKKRCHGADGDDIVLKVPEGTVIMEAQSRKVIADMSGENRRQIVLKGGRGGKGNQHYATPTMQVPKFAQPGQPAQELEVQQLKHLVRHILHLGDGTVCRINPAQRGVVRGLGHHLAVLRLFRQCGKRAQRDDTAPAAFQPDQPLEGSALLFT